MLLHSMHFEIYQEHISGTSPHPNSLVQNLLDRPNTFWQPWNQYTNREHTLCTETFAQLPQNGQELKETCRKRKMSEEVPVKIKK